MSFCKRCGYIPETETMALHIAEMEYEKQRMGHLSLLREEYAALRAEVERLREVVKEARLLATDHAEKKADEDEGQWCECAICDAIRAYDAGKEE